MKTLSSAEYKRHDAITFTLFVAMMIIIVVVALTHTACTTHKQYVQDTAYRHDRSYMQDTVKWNQFIECSKDEGDLGCDSCFFKIYGYYLDDAYETYQ